jgi:hypothetical protein
VSTENATRNLCLTRSWEQEGARGEHGDWRSCRIFGSPSIFAILSSRHPVENIGLTSAPAAVCPLPLGRAVDVLTQRREPPGTGHADLER